MNPITDYIAQFPPEIQAILEQVRQTIREAAPEATEKIAWQMPTFYLNGNLVHFAAAKKHIGIYPGSEGIEAFEKEFIEMGLKYSKGAVQFPINKPMPLDLIHRITEFRVKQNTK